MSTGWVVEVLDRQHRVAQRVPVAAWPITLGRGYGCDVIVDDPYVAAVHAQLTIDAEGHRVLVTDVGSRNGIRRAAGRVGRSGPAEATLLSVAPGEWLETGRTRWRLCEAQTPVPEELALEAHWQIPAWGAAMALLLALGSVGLQTWFGSVDAESPVPALSWLLVVLVALLGWSGLCALLTRLWQPRAHLLEHLAWICTALLVTEVAGWTLDTLAFALDWPLLSTWTRPLELVCVAATLLGHVRIAVGRLPRWAATIAGVLWAVGLGLSLLENWQSQRQLLPAQYMTLLRPPGWHIGRDQPVERVFDRAREQKAEIDALRKVDGAGDDPD